ncbi:hypothetical protein LA080_002651 [Diaporthe eres]|uniref:Uncharacterized protein n=1 Tax=Diaporthe vaccinii TaxID=105482 RepID=A0ABR4EIW2_9PEZI|nr:hypothetical protein LA080_002651 [Diaporthe eres]
MPRQGEGHIAHNAIDANVHPIVYGAGDAKTDEVNRAKKTAPLPEPKKGLAAEGVHASGGLSEPFKKHPDAGQGAPKS